MNATFGADKMSKSNQIELSNDEALILFERLAQLDDQGAFPVKDHAEELVFWKIQSQLEKSLVEPLKPDYRKLVLEAKARVTEKE